MPPEGYSGSRYGSGAAISPDAPAMRRPQVSARLEEVNNSLEDLRKTVEDLGQRLEPVLGLLHGPEGAETLNKPGPQPVQAPLVVALDNTRVAITREVVNLRRIMDRLEV